MAESNISETDAVITAIINEKMAIDHYKNLSGLCRKVGNYGVADFFAEQSKREEGHYNSLVKYRENHPAGSGQAPGEMVKWITKETGAGTQTPAGLDIEAALLQVENAERNAQQFYNQASESASSTGTGAKALFAKLAEDEGLHLYLVQTIRSKLERGGVIGLTDYEDMGAG